MNSQPVHPLIPIEIAIQRLPNGGGLPLPAYASAGAAGMDVVAAETLTLRPGTRHAVATGFAMAIPAGYEVQVRPRSGLALKHGITCLNTPGTIDSDYRGELKIIMINHGSETFSIRRGDRFQAQQEAPLQHERRALLWRAPQLREEAEAPLASGAPLARCRGGQEHCEQAEMLRASRSIANRRRRH